MQAAEKIFNDNVRYNRMLIKRRPSGTAGRWRWELVTPDKVIEKLSEYGIDIGVRTLQRWVKDGLIPTPERGSYGQGKGTWADYPPETVPEALTANLLRRVYRLKNTEIAEARKGFFEGKPTFFKDTYGFYYLQMKPDATYSSVLRSAEEEKEGIINAEHTLKLFRERGHSGVKSMKELFALLENMENNK